MWKKRVFGVFSSARKYMKVLGYIYENFSFMEVNYEYVMVSQSKGIYKAIASSIFFVGGTQTAIHDTTYHERGP